MGHNRAGVIRKARFKRRRREVRRFIHDCTVANENAEKQGIALVDYTRAIREFAEFRK